MRLASGTLEAIDEAIKADCGAAFRQHLGEVIGKMDDAYRGEEPPFRSHQGASTIGRHCERELWYSFRWAFKNDFPPRILRLFNRGHLEEARFIALLQAAGFEVSYETKTGGQFRISHFNGHFGSALDAIVTGIPEIPEGTRAYAEFKTCGENAFNKLVKGGVAKEKPEHVAQMQVCMGKAKLPYALYMAVNKNTDEIYAEVLEYDREVAKEYLARAKRVIFSDAIPDRVGANPNAWHCRFCNAQDICHGGHAVERNCRTCTYSAAEPDGTWSCAKKQPEITTEERFVGCKKYKVRKSMESGHVNPAISGMFDDLDGEDNDEAEFDEWHIGKQTFRVDFVDYSEHTSKKGNVSLRVDYNCGGTIFSHWVGIAAGGVFQKKAERWERGALGSETVALSQSTAEAVSRADEYRCPEEIVVDMSGDWSPIVQFTYEGGQKVRV